VVTSKLIYNIKHVADGNIDMYKDLFMSWGFYDETLSLVVRRSVHKEGVSCMWIEEGFVWAQAGTQGMIFQIRQLFYELGDGFPLILYVDDLFLMEDENLIVGCKRELT